MTAFPVSFTFKNDGEHSPHTTAWLKLCVVNVRKFILVFNERNKTDDEFYVPKSEWEDMKKAVKQDTRRGIVGEEDILPGLIQLTLCWMFPGKEGWNSPPATLVEIKSIAFDVVDRLRVMSQLKD
eukprot:GHVS01070105.1.p1 GENE.GHVS01070105.1~~GHVS01070105.1.p1  ORF type:complete len:125 (+),score=23.66 GHVS01070105.1:299-673(+)